MLPQQTHRLQAQLCGEGEVRAWQVCTSLLPAGGPARTITSESEPWRSQGQEGRGIARLALSLCPPLLNLTL